jgi:sec-independent protein translocase protein TatC
MTLMEHLQELRSRLFRAALGILAGFFVGYWQSDNLIKVVEHPVCVVAIPKYGTCEFQVLGAPDYFLLQLQVGLWTGLLLTSPFWLYQLWAFVAPGLHRHERKWAYVFVGLAAPLFALGAVLAYFSLARGLEFLLPPAKVVKTQLEISRYVSFITTVMMIFGVAFEFPLAALMLNFVGALSGRRMLSWWRAAVFLFFVFAAVVTPTPDPFTMSGLAGAMSLLYFAAVGVALLNDRRRGRKRPSYAGIDDDEISSLDDYAPDPVDGPSSAIRLDPLEPIEPVTKPLPIERRFDDIT